MPTIADVAHHLEQLAPCDLAESFDNVGLLIGDRRREVKKIMVMLDADKHTIGEAIAFGADLIVTHHPILFDTVKSVTDRNILRLVENKIAVYSAHTNLDSAVGGVNDVLAAVLQLRNVTELTFGTLKSRMGDVAECRFGAYIEAVKRQLGISHVRYVGDVNKTVSKIGVLGGGGADFIRQAREAGCDVFVTADLKYHHAQGADDIDMCVIDAGHFETENPVCAVLQAYLAERFPTIEVAVSKRISGYITIV
jgi:dinuclear metal center YbgI/SA1388 family protein